MSLGTEIYVENLGLRIVLNLNGILMFTGEHLSTEIPAANNANFQ